jgi:hypothetical protein
VRHLSSTFLGHQLADRTATTISMGFSLLFFG